MLLSSTWLPESSAPRDINLERISWTWSNWAVACSSGYQKSGAVVGSYMPCKSCTTRMPEASSRRQRHACQACGPAGNNLSEGVNQGW